MALKHVHSKLLLVFSLALSISVLLILLLMVWLQTHLVRAEWQESLQTQARLIAHNSQAALDFQDQREAQRLLHSLERNPNILQASFYVDARQKPFARYSSSQVTNINLPLVRLAQQPGETFRFTDNKLLVWSDIPGDSNEARIEIIASLEQMRQAIWHTAIQTAMYLAGLLAVLLVLANQAARRIASPLQELNRLTTEMTRNPRLSSRFQVRGEDELAQLGSSLNHMLDTLQARDKELERYRLGLEQQVEQRTRELVVAVDAANQASQAKSDFLARISHEIRTPMNTIVGLGQVMLNSGLNEHQRQQQKQVLSASDMLLGLINDILDYSRIEAGKLEIEYIPCNIEQVLKDVSSQLALRAQQRGLELLVHLDTAVPVHILSDPLRLRQILLNLVNNAIKFTEKGEVTVRVAHAPAESGASHGWLNLSVQDTGMGIPANKLDDLFNPFTQVDDSMTRRFGGSGLGLAICRQLAELMGGSIQVKSRDGHGSTFTVSLPCHAADNDLLPSTASRQLQQRVLVIDDNASARDILQSMLDDLGMRTATAASGERGLQMLQQASAAGDPFQLILLDWLMPGMDGIETAQAIRTIAGDIPAILMVTAGNHEQLSTLASRVGLRQILTKPVERTALQEGVLNVLSLDYQQPDTPEQPSDTRYDFSSISHARILLVDDVELNRLVALAMLEETGVHVDIAENGRQAIEMLDQTDYDLILMDIQMPVMDGISATRKIRQQQKFRQLPILAMTAHARISDRDASLAAGMNGHLSKPVSQDTLYQALLKWIPPLCARATEASTDTLQPVSSHNRATDQRPELPELPGIDTVRGLSHSLNKPDLYLRILSRFPAEFGHSLEQIGLAIEAADWVWAHRLAHSLKSAAATIGASTLAAQAAGMEQLLAAQRMPNSAQFNSMCAELRRVCVLLSDLPATSGNTVTTDSGERCSHAALILTEQLQQQLVSDDAAALATLVELQHSLSGIPSAGPVLEQLYEQIEDIEYQAALDILPALRQLLQESTA